MLFVSARVVSNTEVNEEKWIRLKEKIHDAALANGGGADSTGRDCRGTVEK